jgi:O-antigen biosynthesis protein WbqV
VVGVAEELEAIVTRFETRGVRVSRLVLLPSSLQKGAHPEHVLIRARRIGVVVHRIENVRDGGPLRMAPIAVEDLLLRDRVSVDHQLIQSAIRGKSVVVTGGGGSIGAELCRRAVDLEARRLLILESSELALQTVLDELTARQPPCAVEGRVADVRDGGRIQELFAEFHPDIVFHAAALKHVPVLETNAGEAVKTNVFGAMHVADAAVAAGARAFVQISTDKAVAPVSVLGATKRLAEMYCQALDANVRKSGGATRLLAVRFGNVLGSSGSVVPKFQAQIAEGGPVTVTHPEIVRYFMTIAEACDLVIASTAHALSDGASGVSIYALNMGRQIKIAELAERMIRLSGFEPGAGIEIVYVGMRPGERLNEILFADDEQRVDVGIPGIVGTAPAFADLDEIRGRIGALQDGVADRDAIFTALGGASVARRSGRA